MSGGSAGSSGGAGGSRGSNVNHTPKDAQFMAALLKQMGVTEYEPKVIDQMLDFAYKYVTNVLEEAKACSGHAKKRSIDSDDVRLAIHLLSDRAFTNPPPRELLMQAARAKNSQQLPLIKATTGARLPPDRYTLTSVNYRCKTKPRPPAQKSIPGGTQSMLSKTTPAVSLSSKSGATLSLLGGGGRSVGSGSPQVTIVSRPGGGGASSSSGLGGTSKMSAGSGGHPRPHIKLSAGPSGGTSSGVLNKPKPILVGQGTMPPINIVGGASGIDRKRKLDLDAQ